MKMIKARKRFVLYAMLSIGVLLTVLLGIINGVNFTMASQDADRLTQMIADRRGSLSERGDMGNAAPETGSEALPGGMAAPRGTPAPAANMGNGAPTRMGPMGPESPEMAFSLRYFTYAFDEDGEAEQIAWALSAFDEEDALAWAKRLVTENETGWTGSTYRYRVFKSGEKTYVTVIDQGRELLASYRILIISGVGLVLGLAISYFVLMQIGRRLFSPLEDADRKQKRFIAEAEKEFKIPLTVINANTEIIERENGESEQTRSINRQVKRMIGIVKKLATLGVFDERDLMKTRFDLSAIARAAADAARAGFNETGRDLQVTVDDSICINGDSEAMSDLLEELMANAEKFTRHQASLSVHQENGRVTITTINDTNLAEGSVDQVFDRFTRLDNARDVPGVGLGLAHVKEIVRAHNGRASAKVEDGRFILRVSL